MFVKKKKASIAFQIWVQFDRKPFNFMIYCYAGTTTTKKTKETLCVYQYSVSMPGFWVFYVLKCSLSEKVSFNIYYKLDIKHIEGIRD